MSIDNFTEGINIKDLVLDAPAREQPMWYVDISPLEWESLDASVRKIYDLGSREYPAEMLASAAILGLSQQFSIELNDEDYRLISSDLIRRKSGTSILEFDMGEASLAARTKILFPEKDIVADTNISADFMLSLVTRRDHQPRWYSQGIINFAILFPEQLGALKETDIKERLVEYSRDSDPSVSIESNAALRLAFPDGYKKLDDSYFVNMQKLLERKKHTGENDFLTYASYLKILGAKEVKLSEAGLQLTMPESEFLPIEKSKMPKRKRF